jgi:hypothetical protein
MALIGAFRRLSLAGFRYALRGNGWQGLSECHFPRTLTAFIGGVDQAAGLVLRPTLFIRITP